VKNGGTDWEAKETNWGQRKVGQNPQKHSTYMKSMSYKNN